MPDPIDPSLPILCELIGGARCGEVVEVSEFSEEMFIKTPEGNVKYRYTGSTDSQGHRKFQLQKEIAA